MPLLKLLGTPRLVTEKGVLDLPPKQVSLLASYLAYKEDWCSRDELLHLFWPDEGEKEARHNLSQRLYQAKGQAWVTSLETERNRVRWLVDTDVKNFRDALGDGDWKAASERYEGALLEGVTLETSSTYDDWLVQERESLQTAWREAALNHAATLEAEGAFAEAAELLQRVLKHDPLAEDALQGYLRAAHGTGHRARALRAFADFEAQLQSELGMPPLDETVALAETIRTADHAAPTTPTTSRSEGTPVQTSLVSKGTSTLRNLPTQLTSFVGREVDLAEIASALEGGDTRLLTLVGPGGIGKTRLAVQTLQEQGMRFADGAVFVPLAAVASADAVVQEIAKSLGLTLGTKASPEQQLLDYLRAKEMLVALDNFEHILDAAGVVTDILEASPRSRLLVSSREAIGLQGETLYEVRGLAVPTREVDEHADRYDAVQLFVRSARRVQTGFGLVERDKGLVVRICQLLGGVPLALELAAGWLRILSLGEIHAELKRSLDLLETEGRGVPERHRSMRATFEHSWALLDGQEQDALLKLSVFRGGFRRDASDAVTQTPLRVLLALVNKSMIYRTLTGRFERHPLIYEFCHEKFIRQDDAREVQKRHAEYFLDLAEEAAVRLEGSEQKAWFARLDEEHDNLQAVLEWSLAQEKVELGLRVAVAIGRYWVLEGHFELGRAWLERLRGHLPPGQEALRCVALVREGSLLDRLGRSADAAALYDESLRLANDMGDRRGVADTLYRLGLIDYNQANHGEARARLEKSLSLYRELGNRHGTASTLGALGWVVSQLADYDEAEVFYRESLELSRELGNPQDVAAALNNMGRLAIYQLDHLGAKPFIEEGLALYREIGDRGNVAKCLNSLGVIARILSDHHEAMRLFEECAEIARDLGDQRATAGYLHNIALCATALGDLDAAQEHFAEALAMARATGMRHLSASIKSSLSKTIRDRGDYAEAGRLLAESLVEHRDLGAKRDVALVLAQIAVLLAMTDKHEPSIATLAASDALTKRIGAPLYSPWLVATVEEWKGRFREMLGDETFDDLYGAGEALSLDEAVDIALAGLAIDAPYAARESGRELTQER